MAGGGAGAQGSVKVEGGGNQKYGFALSIMVSLFFMIGFITVLNDVLIPSLKGLFDLSASQAMLIQFCFFIAYAILSFPAGMLIEKVGYKKGLIISLAVMAAGLFFFVIASMVQMYGVFLFALFVVASGITILQVAINPYIIALGPEETGASRLNLGGALNSTATFIGPIIGGAFILKSFSLEDFGGDQALLNAAKAEAVRGPYIVLALVTLLIAAILYFTSLPKIATESAEKVEDGTSPLDFLHLKLGSGAIFFYVGAEVAIGSLLVLYLTTQNLIILPTDITEGLSHEGLESLYEKMASSLLAYYWGAAMVGRFIGSAVGQKIKANTLLAIVAVVALVLVTYSMVGGQSARMDISVIVLSTDPFSIGLQSINVPVVSFALVLVGLFNSVMWPAIFPLGIAKLGKHTSKGSGIMVTMVLGGAVVPYVQGLLAESIGYRFSFIICIICYAYLLFFALKGYNMGKIATMEDEDVLEDFGTGNEH